MAHSTDESEPGLVPVWLWRTTLGMLVLVIAAGLTLALWLGARPMVIGAPISAQELGAWTFGPDASGDEAGGRLTLRTSAPERPAYATSALVLSDSTVQVRARLLTGPDDAGYGLVVRYQGPDDFAALLVGPDGYIAIGQMAGGTWRWRVPWQQWPHVKRGQAENLLRAGCRADRCRFWVNDELAFETDQIPVQGQIGPVVWNPAQGESVSASFEEWRVWR